MRKLVAALGLPHEMGYWHPFPGPGLGVPILGEVKKEYGDLLRRAHTIFFEELGHTAYVATVVPDFDQDGVPANGKKQRRRRSPFSCRWNR